MLAIYFIEVSCQSVECLSDLPYGTSKRVPAIFVGSSWAACETAARTAGWLLEAGGGCRTRATCTCPSCHPLSR